MTGAPIGHDGIPSLNNDRDSPTAGQCRHCQHWTLPPGEQVRDYELFQLGLARRRVKRPSGACDRVLMRPGGPLSFAATTDSFGCLNFAAKAPPPIQRGRGFVTIYEDDRIVWQGCEEDMPEAYH